MHQDDHSILGSNLAFFLSVAEFISPKKVYTFGFVEILESQ